MFPLSGHPPAHCSTTRMRSRLLPGRSRPFQFCWYVPSPASSSSRLVAVDVHFSCCRRELPLPGLTVPVSGAAVGDPWVAVLRRRNAPASQKSPSLSLAVSWMVRRSVGVIVPESLLRAGREKSGSYSHFVGSPAFLLWNIPGIVLPLPW